MNFLLFSGGMDSALILSNLVRNDEEVTCIFVDYGQEACDAERTSAQKISGNFQVPLLEIKYASIPLTNKFYYAGRNLALIAICTTLCREGDSIYIGANASDRADFPDCTYDFFIGLIQTLYLGYKVHLKIPLISTTKQEIHKLAAISNIHDYSYCYTPIDNLPCGTCLSCITHKNTL